MKLISFNTRHSESTALLAGVQLCFNGMPRLHRLVVQLLISSSLTRTETSRNCILTEVPWMINSSETKTTLINYFYETNGVAHFITVRFLLTLRFV